MYAGLGPNKLLFESAIPEIQVERTLMASDKRKDKRITTELTSQFTSYQSHCKNEVYGIFETQTLISGFIKRSKIICIVQVWKP